MQYKKLLVNGISICSTCGFLGHPTIARMQGEPVRGVLVPSLGAILGHKKA